MKARFMWGQLWSGISTKISRAVGGSDWFERVKNTDVANAVSDIGNILVFGQPAPSRRQPTAPREPKLWPIVPMVLVIGSGLAVAWFLYRKGR